MRQFIFLIFVLSGNFSAFSQVYVRQTVGRAVAVSDAEYCVRKYLPVTEKMISKDDKTKFVVYFDSDNNYINIYNPEHEDLTVTVFDIQGKILALKQSHSSRVYFDFGGCAKGCYFVQIQNKYRTENHKFMR